MIEIKPAGRGFNLQELWEYRELLYFLTLRDIKVRYKQTLLGVAWAVIQPTATMLVFSIFFGRLAKIPSDGIPYPVFTYAALVPWTFFSNGLRQSSESLVLNSILITRAYFPRLIIPLSAILSGVVDFLLAFGVLLILIVAYGIIPGWNLIFLPFFVLLAVVTTLGVGLWLAALNARFRDVRYTVPFLTQLWLFMTPIVYPGSLLDDPWRTLYGLNPMAGVVEGMRWSLLGTHTTPQPIFIVSSLVALGLLISGLLYFKKMEITFADVI